MPWNPRTQRPIWDGANPDQQAIQQPIQVIRQAQVNSDWDPGADIQVASDQVEAYHGPSIANFVDRSRTYSERSGLDSTRTNWSAPGIELRYEKLFGYERMFITTYPQNFNPGGQGADINLDGYIMILSYFSNKSTQGSSNSLKYDFQLNGKSLGNYTFTLGNSPEAVVIKLGPTALRCWSLADEDFPKANPNKHVNVIIPPRAKIKKHQNTFFWFPFAESQGLTGTIPDHSDLPVYAIYDWNSVYNSGADAGDTVYLYINGEKITLAQMALNNIPITVITPDFSNDSNPIKNRDLNKFRAVCDDTITYYTGGGNIILQAEFYSRYYTRTVDQSWNMTGGNILVNDTPLYFGMRTGFANQLPLDIDLTPQKIDRTTPTPESGYDINAGSAPYINGYWRIGDAVSEYTYISPGSWSYLAALVTQYYTFITNLKKFFDNELDIGITVVVTFNPENGTQPIGESSGGGGTPTYYWDYQVSPVFWPPDFVDYGSDDPTIMPLNTQLQQLVDAQYQTWTANNTTAQTNLKTQSIYYSDSTALDMLVKLVSDAAALQSMFVGADLSQVQPGAATFPIYNTLLNPNVPVSPWWKRLYGAGDNNQIFSTALAVQIYYQSQETYFFGNEACSFVVNTLNQSSINTLTQILQGIADHKDV